MTEGETVGRRLGDGHGHGLDGSLGIKAHDHEGDDGHGRATPQARMAMDEDAWPMALPMVAHACPMALPMWAHAIPMGRTMGPHGLHHGDHMGRHGQADGTGMPHGGPWHAHADHAGPHARPMGAMASRSWKAMASHGPAHGRVMGRDGEWMETTMEGRHDAMAAGRASREAIARAGCMARLAGRGPLQRTTPEGIQRHAPRNEEDPPHRGEEGLQDEVHPSPQELAQILPRPLQDTTSEVVSDPSATQPIVASERRHVGIGPTPGLGVDPLPGQGSHSGQGGAALFSGQGLSRHGSG